MQDYTISENNTLKIARGHLTETYKLYNNNYNKDENNNSNTLNKSFTCQSYNCLLNTSEILGFSLLSKNSKAKKFLFI